MNKAYVKGRQREYQLKNFLEDNGYLVIRSAGSKKIDLIAFRKDKWGILLINIGAKDKKRIEYYGIHKVWQITYNSNNLKELKEELKKASLI
ncbi:MAG: hypothetical protein NZ608_07780 [candidate division WOR-3 bacterium]|nr:hypothetical protein [candidate division WOR-3 bacterium]